MEKGCLWDRLYAAIGRILGAEGVRPRDLAAPVVVKVDIDSYECALAEALLLGGLRPKIWILEINWNIPVPFKFSSHFSPGTAIQRFEMFETGNETT